MRLTFLGTGTSFGVPVVGCPCETCRAGRPRDQRTRHSALIEGAGRRVLIDTPPELRLQLLAADVEQIDAVWYTHFHADHTHGIDDLRVFSMLSGIPLPVYASMPTVEMLACKFDYIFDPQLQPLEGTFKPEATLQVLEPYATVEIAGMAFRPLPVPHGPLEPYGFRIGDLGYITDAKALPPQTRAALEGVQVLVLNALWFGESHPTHFNVEEAVEVALEIGAQRTFLTHISHLAAHAELERRLPESIRPAYDGLVVEF